MGHRFHARSYSGEPYPAKFARNLFSHDWCNGSKLSESSDDPGELWPEVALVFLAFSFTCSGERLTGAGACDDMPVVGPTGDFESKTPACDSGKEVVLCVSHKVGWLCFGDRSNINMPLWYQAVFYQPEQPGGCVWIVFVVVVQSESLTEYSADEYMVAELELVYKWKVK